MLGIGLGLMVGEILGRELCQLLHELPALAEGRSLEQGWVSY